LVACPLQAGHLLVLLVLLVLLRAVARPQAVHAASWLALLTPAPSQLLLRVWPLRSPSMAGCAVLELGTPQACATLVLPCVLYLQRHKHACDSQ
jgi:hypothetical protein